MQEVALTWLTFRDVRTGCATTSECERVRSGLNWLQEEDMAVDALAEKLDARLREWKPETAAQVRERVAEVIGLADLDVLDLMRPRAIEQEVLDLLDEPAPW